MKHSVVYFGIFSFLVFSIIITRFFASKNDLINLSTPPEKIAEILDKLNFKQYEITENTEQALVQAQKDEDTAYVVTGSLYLVAEMRPYLSTR